MWPCACEDLSGHDSCPTAWSSLPAALISLCFPFWLFVTFLKLSSFWFTFSFLSGLSNRRQEDGDMVTWCFYWLSISSSPPHRAATKSYTLCASSLSHTHCEVCICVCRWLIFIFFGCLRRLTFVLCWVCSLPLDKRCGVNSFLLDGDVSLLERTFNSLPSQETFSRGTSQQFHIKGSTEMVQTESLLLRVFWAYLLFMVSVSTQNTKCDWKKLHNI